MKSVDNGEWMFDQTFVKEVFAVTAGKKARGKGKNPSKKKGAMRNLKLTDKAVQLPASALHGDRRPAGL